jgi:uncharacterized protein (TIGR00255 family)
VQTPILSAHSHVKKQKKSKKNRIGPFLVNFTKFYSPGFYFIQPPMLLSMTGYGRATATTADKTITIELRSLNSKLTDIKLKYPAEYKEKEHEIRKIIADQAERGKIDFTLEVTNADGSSTVGLNIPLLKGYFHALASIADELSLDKSELLPTLIRIPNVVGQTTSEVQEEEWNTIRQTLLEALHTLKVFRLKEGEVHQADLQIRIGNILALLKQVEPFEVSRMTKLRQKLLQNLTDGFATDQIDRNRFEQELLYYLERMDITEEKIRLEQHCRYFLEQFTKQEQSAGRTLGFISQEIGREINTLGSKAYHADIQKCVVQMKDELEKIKEQLANIV